MNNKKGISAIVATVLIILITVAAVTIIWAAIIPMISNELDGATECFDASAALSVITDYSCYNESSGNVSVQVARATGDFTLIGLDVLVSYEGSAETVTYGENEVPDANGAMVYVITNRTFPSPKNHTLGRVDQASVAARVQAGQTEKLCDGSAVTSIRVCA
jgi:flagellin-like protein